MTIKFDPLPVYLAVAGAIFTVGVVWGWWLRDMVYEARREREKAATEEESGGK